MRNMATSKVFAQKIYNHQVSEDTVYLGDIEFSSLEEAFIKTIRLHNRYARKRIIFEMFTYRGRRYSIADLGLQSKNGRGYTQYWTLDRMSKKAPYPFSLDYKGKPIDEYYIMTIPKSKVNNRDWMKYIE